MSKKSAKLAEKLLHDIRKIARLDGNKQCVDCPEKVCVYLTCKQLQSMLPYHLSLYLIFDNTDAVLH
jgi:hypothetical protein